jgi:hypothetical protein
MPKERLADDLLLGARALAEWTGASERQIYYWAQIRRFGLFRIGDKIAGRKSTIMAHMARLEAGEGA